MWGMLNEDKSEYYTTKPGDRIFFYGAPGNGWVNFGKETDGIQDLFFEDGRMYIPANCPTDSMESIAEYCGFDFRDRHPVTLEPLDLIN